MVLTVEMLEGFMEAMRHQGSDPTVMIISPKMHKKIYILERMKGLFPEPTFKIRKIYIRRAAKRRKKARRRAEATYERRYPMLPFKQEV